MIDGAISQSILAARAREQAGEAKRVGSIQLEEALRIYAKQQCQKRVLQIEIEKLLMQAAVVAIDGQVAAISKSLEMCSNRIDKYVPS